MSGQRHATLVAAASLALTMTPMFGLFEGISWTFPILLTITVVAVTGSLVRAGGRGQGLQTLSMIAALLVLLTAAFGNGTAIVFVIPTPATFQEFAYLISVGVADVVTQAPPVAAEGGILFLTMAGVGIVAILHDMFVVGLRTPALSGLTLLTMYLVPVSVAPDATSWFWFILPAAAYLWVLGDDNLRRVSRFGHRFTGQGQLVGPRFPSPMASAARISAVVFITVTLMILAVIPANTSGLLDQVSNGVGGDGGDANGLGSLNPWAQLSGSLQRPDPVEVARLTTDDPSPRYLRMHIADQLSSDGFEPSDYADLEPLDSLDPAGGETFTAQVTNLGLSDEVVPVYGRPSSIEIDGDWGVEPNTDVIAADGTSLADVDSYSFTYSDPSPEAANLAREGTMDPSDPAWERNTDHPDVPELTDRVDTLMGEAGATTVHDKVLAVKDHLSSANGFTYSLDTIDAGNDEAILDFLDTKQGYCQQYAAAMAWMLREADVPARVAIGLSQGTKIDGEWSFSTSDFHAWVEVYYEDSGWVTYDPTPSGGVAGSVAFPWASEPTDTDEQPNPDETDEPTDEASSAAPDDQDPSANADPTDGVTQDAAPDSESGGFGFNPAWLALLLLAVPPFIPMLWRGAIRRSRLSPGRLSATTAWDEARDLARDYGAPLADSLTPRQASVKLAAAAPGAAPAAEALGSAMEAHRYSPRGADPAGLGDAVADLRTELDRGAEPTRRWRARLWPASLATWLVAWRESAADRLSGAQSRMGRTRRSNEHPNGTVTGRP
ncbi:DUF3488 and transglutaminase-like domain-containing protein [Glycomyces buryatensis]|uniref:Transglutaminase domain-containing protein n=1 Tax=Glycomyces buryatensis TaxID=2570927 RepID=A0A4S8Q320_9ACTN|nr:DUF3488 and transglutaminase-like domain-containing protein [Glycomyces buryatensis]THV38597.1 transglutaminase domain-containing protein [Glycomyces buryatensis]